MVTPFSLPNIAIIGATGMVGRRFLQLLEKNAISVKSLRLFASERSKATSIAFHGKPYPLETLQKAYDLDTLKTLDLCFFDASDAVSSQWVPELAKRGITIIDNSSVFRMDPQIPLIVPGVNADKIPPSYPQDWKSYIISGPNCATAQLVCLLSPIAATWGLQRVIVTTFQSVSGAGAHALATFLEHTKLQLKDPLKATHPNPYPFADTLPFNCIPQIGTWTPDGWSSEEIKIMQETKKILDLPDLDICTTAVRTPTVLGHAQSVTLETQRPYLLKELIEVLKASPTLRVFPLAEDFPSALSTSADRSAITQDAVLIGRLRSNHQQPCRLHAWIVADNLQKGAALNGLQIAQAIAHRFHEKMKN